MTDNKSIVMYSSYAEKRMNFNLEYKGLPEAVVRELTVLLGGLSERIKGSVQLSVIKNRGAFIETFEDGEGIGELDTKAVVDAFINANEELLDAVGKFHYLYFTPEGADFRGKLADSEK